jgi:bifunctional non-homologous end joining protein LigD
MKVPFHPMLATLVHEVPTGPHWVFEEKYDGIRALAVRRRGAVRLYSRTLRELTFADIARDVVSLPGRDLVLDGEIVALDRRGVSRFQLLQRLGKDRVTPRYAVFDRLEDDGRSLFRVPLDDRRAALERLLPERRGTLLLARRLPRDGARAYAMAKEKGWEGIIAKDDRSLYEPGRRSRAWLKIKVRKESEFVIGGYTPPAGARPHFGALLVGLYDRERLRYVGKVGTGFTHETLGMLAAQLTSLRTPHSPFDPPLRMSEATWVQPRLVAQVAFAEWTADGKLRQAAFLGLRTDKPPEECRWSEREV